MKIAVPNACSVSSMSGPLSRVIFAEYFTQDVGDLAERRPSPQRFLHRRKKVAGPLGRSLHLRERDVRRRLVARALQLARALGLALGFLLADALQLGKLLVLLHELVHD